MSIQSEINRIDTNIQDTIDVIRETGVSVPSGANSDNLPSLASALSNEKQDKLTGLPGQYVRFNSSGEPESSDLSTDIMLKSGGTFTGTVAAKSQNISGAYIRNVRVQNSSSVSQSTNYIIMVRK